MWKNSLKNVESDNNKIVYGNLLDFLQRNGNYCVIKSRILLHSIYIFYFYYYLLYLQAIYIHLVNKQTCIYIYI